MATPEDLPDFFARKHTELARAKRLIGVALINEVMGNLALFRRRGLGSSDIETPKHEHKQKSGTWNSSHEYLRFEFI